MELGLPIECIRGSDHRKGQLLKIQGIKQASGNNLLSSIEEHLQEKCMFVYLGSMTPSNTMDN